MSEESLTVAWERADGSFEDGLVGAPHPQSFFLGDLFGAFQFTKIGTFLSSLTIDLAACIPSHTHIQICLSVTL